MRPWLAAPLALAACNYPGGVQEVRSVSPAGISIMYYHWNSDELPLANATAERHCAAYGRHAAMTGSSPDGVTGNRTIAHYTCVQ